MHNETESACQIVTNNSDGPIIFFMSLPLYVGMCSCVDVCTYAHTSHAGMKIKTLFLVPFNFPAHTNYRLLSNRATEISSYVDSINLTETAIDIGITHEMNSCWALHFCYILFLRRTPWCQNQHQEIIDRFTRYFYTKKGVEIIEQKKTMTGSAIASDISNRIQSILIFHSDKSTYIEFVKNRKGCEKSIWNST